ncbi:2-ketoisovalerate ferredoxin oxidoreductase subunit alpha [Campylobacterota bacterium]|nr:2-ketoisovalerate ferredoxin oxidoreductase subunit alpha [Campylobacterota bacterium]
MATQEKVVWDGNTAAAQAMRQAQIDVVAAYPITPSTPIVQRYSQFVADGEVKGEFVMVESEHSAMSACVGAAAAGGRVATATSSQGYALMIEVLYQASGMRLPIVMNVVNRALAAPLNIHGDHADMYLGRDAGWINLCAFNPQEAYDLNFIAFKTAEDMRVRLPVAVNQDGFLTSHTTELVQCFDDESAYNFMGKYIPHNPMLDLEHPVTYGAQTEGEWHYEHKMRHNHAIVESQKVIEENFAAFEKFSGRKYQVIETYKTEDADEIIVAIGSVTGTTQMAINELRKEGRKVGLAAIRLWRPFPKKELAAALKNAKTIAVLDRSAPLGSTGALYNETAAVLVENGLKAVLLNYLYGIGGRDTTLEDLTAIFKDAAECTSAGKRVKPIMQTVNLRGKPLHFYP